MRSALPVAEAEGMGQSVFGCHRLQGPPHVCNTTTIGAIAFARKPVDAAPALVEADACFSTLKLKHLPRYQPLHLVMHHLFCAAYQEAELYLAA